MPLKIRLIRTGRADAFYNMGLDEALLESAREGGLPVLRFYGWEPPAVSIGYFQKISEVVNRGACAQRGVDIVRRLSGGGAVFHQAEVTYSVIFPPPCVLPPFELICGAVMEGLSILGVSSRFKPVNDIYTGEKKISGSAQIRRGDTLLQHGTVLLDTDPLLMRELLGVSASKVTGLRAVLDRPVSFEDAEEALAEGFRRRLSLEYAAETGGSSPVSLCSPTAEEDERARVLARERFASPGFINRS
ncbi:MAG: lipoate--protein ligase family protein [Treponema sp.]|jgi:lipoate-protein ligase A|nr:lipoate--protein ligase family protein [Treponema sp.]